MKHIYNYDAKTGELISEEMASLDPAETKLKGKNVYLLPAHATFVEPPISVDNKIQIFNEGTRKWSMRSDYRGLVHYDPEGNRYEITDLGKRIPKNHTTKAPPSNLIDPQWNGKKWNGGIVFRGKKIEDKTKVDRIISREITELGEEKAKTLYLIAFKDGLPCPEWDTFLKARQDLLDEANAFISENNLV